MKKWLVENKWFLVFLLGFGVFRTAIADWNPIPSGSMRPTILEGDVVLVNRLAYNIKVPLTDTALARLAEPQRGDIVTFSSPKDGTRLIKRIVALPGETVEMRGSVLFIDGVAAQYDSRSQQAEPIGQGATVMAVHAMETIAGPNGGAGHTHPVQFLPAVHAKRNFGPLRVPADSYFMLGDNRDNSEDSRYIGAVPRHLLIGRAHHLVLSAAINGNWLPRLDRFGKVLN